MGNPHMHMLTMSEIIHFTVNYTHFTTHASLANNAEHFRGQAHTESNEN